MSQPVNNDPITRDRGATTADATDKIIERATRKIFLRAFPKGVQSYSGIPGGKWFDVCFSDTAQFIRDAINEALDIAVEEWKALGTAAGQMVDEMANAGVIHPTFGIGSLVHYIDICRADDKIKHYPAIVTEVLSWNPGFPGVRLHLFVMGVDAGFSMQSLVPQNPAEQNLPGTWHYPEREE